MNSVVSPDRGALVRPPSVAGTFYPQGPEHLRAMVDDLLAAADRIAHDAAPAPPATLVGLLVPHAGLEYSGVVAATGWRSLRAAGGAGGEAPVVVVLGTNHRAAWLDGIGAWDAGAWRTPLGDVPVDAALANEIVELGPPFFVDREAHLGEHSIEVQLPLLQAVSPATAIVPLAVAAGTGPEAVAAGTALGARLGEVRRRGIPVVLAISSDMAHYPPEAACRRVTTELLPSILALDAAGLATQERSVVRHGEARVACGMCGISPTVVGLSALRAMGAEGASALAAATSADAGGPRDRAVGYLAVRFDA